VQPPPSLSCAQLRLYPPAATRSKEAQRCWGAADGAMSALELMAAAASVGQPQRAQQAGVFELKYCWEAPASMPPPPLPPPSQQQQQQRQQLARAEPPAAPSATPARAGPLQSAFGVAQPSPQSTPLASRPGGLLALLLDKPTPDPAAEASRGGSGGAAAVGPCSQPSRPPLTPSSPADDPAQHPPAARQQLRADADAGLGGAQPWALAMPEANEESLTALAVMWMAGASLPARGGHGAPGASLPGASDPRSLFVMEESELARDLRQRSRPPTEAAPAAAAQQPLPAAAAAASALAAGPLPLSLLGGCDGNSLMGDVLGYSNLFAGFGSALGGGADPSWLPPLPVAGGAQPPWGAAQTGDASFANVLLGRGTY
jgi:hypothetical protein